MKKVSEVIKVQPLDYAPKFEDSGPDKILAASGILTMKNKDFAKTLGKIDDKTLKGFHNEATRRGHASLTTSANYYFWIEGSRIIDFYFSSFPFGSYLVFSSRRIRIETENLVIPDSIKNSKFKNEYENLCKKMVDLYHRIEDETGNKDYARRVLPIGFISKLFFSLPLQVVLGIIKEVKEDKKRKEPLLPKELWEMSKTLEAQIKKNTNYLADASLNLFYNTNYPHPNLFNSNTDFQKPYMKILLKDDDFGKMLKDVKDKINRETGSPKEKISETSRIWKEFVDNIQDKILLEVKIKGSLSIWNDIKRHRSVRQKVESIYHAADRCLKNWDRSNFDIPPIENDDLKKEMVGLYKEAIELYKKMIDNGIEKRDAMYIIPHGIYLGIRLFLDGYHIFDPFGFIGIRACTHTDHEIILMINKLIGELNCNLPEIKGLIGPKCKIGFCPERNFCGVIKQFVRDYDENMHSAFQ
jgi:thymidylate synthase ThyX